MGRSLAGCPTARTPPRHTSTLALPCHAAVPFRDPQGTLPPRRCRARGWARLGAAQLMLGHPRASMSAYTRGMQLDPGSEEMALGLQLARAALEAQGNRREAVGS
jgi:hypothetical protein